MLILCMAQSQMQAGQSCITGWPAKRQSQELPRYQTIAGQLQKATKKIDPALNNELFEAVKSGDINRVRYLLHLPLPWWYLLKKYDAIPDINAPGDEDDFYTLIPKKTFTPLTLASYRGNIEMVKLLLAAHADPDAHDGFGSTALNDAVRYNRTEIVKLLIQNHANIDLAERRGNKFTPLLGAIFGGDEEIVQILLNAGADPNIRDDWGQPTWLNAILKFRNHPEIAYLLLAAGAKTKEGAGVRAVRDAIQDSKPDILLQLLRAGAQIPDDKFLLAAARKQPSIMKAIEQYNKEIGGKEAIQQATAAALPMEGWQDIANIIGEYAEQPLVVFNEKQEIAKKNEKEIKYDMQVVEGALTPWVLQGEEKENNARLIAAIETKGASVEQIGKLLDHATLNARDVDGNTPLIVATIVNRPDVVDLLLKRLSKESDYREYINMRDNAGHTALWWAKKMKRNEIVDLLLNAGASRS